MSFRRVKEVSYNDEDEDYDEYGEDAGDELSPEDKKQLEVGTIAVRAELDPDIIVSDKEVQDALWHYYYDIGKSVTYLKNLKKPQPKQEKKKQTPNRFDQAANAAASKSSHKTNNRMSPFVSLNFLSHTQKEGYAAPLHFCYQIGSRSRMRPCTELRAWIDLHTSVQKRSNPGSDALGFGDRCCMFTPAYPQALGPADYFRGVSWRRDEIDPETLSDLIPQFENSRGGLLGGSSKPSKLAALAASRKKKEEEKRNITPKSSADQSERAVALLDRLNLKQENVSPQSASDVSEVTSTRLRFTAARHKDTEQTEDEPQEPESAPEPEMRTPPPDMRATPSLFAQAICRNHSSSADEDHSETLSDGSRQWSSGFTFPYANDPQYIKSDPFARPSPDDVVLKAQSKGSLGS